MSTNRGSRDPLILVVAEVHFSPVLAIERHIASIQERLRKEGFPEYHAAHIGSDDPWKNSLPMNCWQFADRNNQTAIILDTNRFVLECSCYTESEPFIEIVRLASSLVSETAAPAWLDHVSLRYIHLIRDIGERKAKDFIRPTTGQLDVPNFATETHYHYMAAEFETLLGLVRVNAMQSCDELITPPDIAPCVELDVQLKEDECKIILDIDHLALERDDFSVETIEQKFRALHADFVQPTFESIVTTEALQLWEGNL